MTNFVAYYHTHKTLGVINFFTFVVFVCTVQDAAEHAEVHDNVVSPRAVAGPQDVHQAAHLTCLTSALQCASAKNERQT